MLLGALSRKKMSLPAKGAAGSGIITAVELITGLVFNRDHSVWDYRDMPLHFRGQICLPYMLLWVPVSLGAMVLYRGASRLLH